MPNYTAFRAAWLTLSSLGQIGTGVLIITYIVVKRLPQRNNPYLFNLVFTSFIVTIPPSLLGYSGNLVASPPHSLCFAQSGLMNGIFPMVATAQFALVFDTWSELRSLAKWKRHISRNPVIQYFLIAAPYLMFWIWSTVSLTTVQGEHGAEVSLPQQLVYCVNADGSHNAPFNMLKTWVGYYQGALEAVQLFLGVWVCFMIYRYPCKVSDDPHAFRTTIQFSIRVLVFTFVQFVVVLLNAFNGSSFATRSQQFHDAIEMIKPFYPVTVFVVFGTQKNILQTWLRRRPEFPFEDEDPRPASEMGWTQSYES